MARKVPGIHGPWNQRHRANFEHTHVARTGILIVNAVQLSILTFEVVHFTGTMKFSAAFVALIAGASAFTPAQPSFARTSVKVYNLEKGAGGMFDTRNPEPVKHEDARKSITEAPSFEEYMKMRNGGAPAAAPAAPAPAAPAPAPAAWSPPAAPAWAPPAAPAWAPPAAPAWSPPAPAPAPAAWSPPAPAPAPAAHGGAPAKGAGGMFDTRDPAPVKHEDARKSISEAPSFEEYMKMRNQ